jgi:hypothetical protein
MSKVTVYTEKNIIALLYYSQDVVPFIQEEYRNLSLGDHFQDLINDPSFLSCKYDFLIEF